MKHFNLFCLVGLSMLFACNHPNSESNTTENDKNTKVEKAELAKYFYKRLEGEIAGKHVVMHLEKIDSTISGAYYYDGSWLNLRLDTLIGKDSIVLFENTTTTYYSDDNAKQPQLLLKWNGKGFNGNWHGGKDKKNYPINLEEKYPAGSYAFTLSTFADTSKAYPKKEKSPAATIGFQYLEATAKNKSTGYLNAELKKMMGLKANQTDWISGFKIQTAKYFADYHQDIKAFSSTNSRDTATFWANYTNNFKQKILFNDQDFVVFEYYIDSYSGGAHGNYNSEMYCYDVKNQRKLALTDLVKIDSNTLQNLLERNLRKQYNIKAGEGLNTVLFDSFLKPNKNFYFNTSGIAFLYNPYEVASYAQGQVVVFIPFNELKTYLVPSFAQRIKLK